MGHTLMTCVARAIGRDAEKGGAAAPFWPVKVPLRGRNSQHGGGRHVQQPMRHAPEEQARNRSLTSGAHTMRSAPDSFAASAIACAAPPAVVPCSSKLTLSRRL